MFKRTTKEPGEYISISGLKYEGWTEGAIATFLGEPDKIAKNPHYKSASPMKLYIRDKVTNIQQTEEWKQWFDGAKEKRKKASERQKVQMDKRRKELVDYINELEIEIPKYSKDKLYKMAVENYNSLWLSRGKSDKWASLKDDASFLNRIAVNMLRHCFSNYEYELESLYGKVGKDDGYVQLKSRILEKIEEVYPYLSDACV